MEGLPGQSLLHNRYWILRHGRSIPNEAGIIVSLLSNGVMPKYGLAPAGKVQACLAAELFLKKLQSRDLITKKLRIYSSPFSRTKETAEGVVQVLREQGVEATIELVEELRERYFGPALELQSAEHYVEIWNIDARDPMTGPEDGESAADVARRLANVIVRIEDEVQGCDVLIVSHGDPLQILQTIFDHALIRKQAKDDTLQGCLHGAIDPYVLQNHRKFDLGTGELRCLPGFEGCY